MSDSLKPELVAWYRRPTPIIAPDGFDARFAEANALLQEAAAHTPCVFANSLSAEDMVIFHLIATQNLQIHTIALDTGKLPAATVELWRRAEALYSRRIERVQPSDDDVAELDKTGADTALYESKSVRLHCCELRKTRPLRAALRGHRAWVTGLRRAQSTGRANVAPTEFDISFQLNKLNPLYSWGEEDIWYFVDKHSIPHSALYYKGYASIGCHPCTRPIRASEPPRAGRWWWEQTEGAAIASECGIHVVANHSN